MSPYDHGQQLFHDMMPKFASGYEFGSEEWVECSIGWKDARNEQLAKKEQGCFKPSPNDQGLAEEENKMRSESATTQ